jgi:hypothetical protein
MGKRITKGMTTKKGKHLEKREKRILKWENSKKK